MTNTQPVGLSSAYRAAEQCGVPFSEDFHVNKFQTLFLNHLDRAGSLTTVLEPVPADKPYEYEETDQAWWEDVDDEVSFRREHLNAIDRLCVLAGETRAA